MRIRDQTKNAIKSVMAFVIGFIIPLLAGSGFVYYTFKYILLGV